MQWETHLRLSFPSEIRHSATYRKMFSVSRSAQDPCLICGSVSLSHTIHLWLGKNNIGNQWHGTLAEQRLHYEGYGTVERRAELMTGILIGDRRSVCLCVCAQRMGVHFDADIQLYTLKLKKEVLPCKSKTRFLNLTVPRAWQAHGYQILHRFIWPSVVPW